MRVRKAVCIVQNGKVAMSAWKLKWALSGDRSDFQVNMARRTCSLSCALQTPLARARARARVRPRQEICIVRNGKVAMLAWKLK